MLIHWCEEHNAQQSLMNHDQLKAIEGVLVMMLRAEGRSFRAIRRLFPHTTLPDIKTLSGETS